LEDFSKELFSPEDQFHLQTLAAAEDIDFISCLLAQDMENVMALLGREENSPRQHFSSRQLDSPRQRVSVGLEALRRQPENPCH
jgi:hypothetical protein